MATVLIDNYDSFTWNVYQYLSAAGAQVQVFRNDQTTLDHIISLNPCNIVLSPGPGFPGERTGICEEVLDYFEGKIPVLGVCLGEQIMFERYGGKVTLAGEIYHGKISIIQHDGRGVFQGIPQGVQVTRYHSLAGLPSTLPGDLEVNSWTDNGMVMGVRHRKYTVTGVQFHPESILSDHGMVMIRNFLALRGGTWDVNPGALTSKLATPTVYDVSLWKPTTDSVAPRTDSPQQPSILDKIYAQRRLDVASAKAQPGRSQQDLEAQLGFGSLTSTPASSAPALIDVVARIQNPKATPPQGTPLAVMAEVKRASPSKGNIRIDAVATEEGLKYAQAGADVISVLTEPTWFKGSLEDMRDVRQALEQVTNRPAVLRKDFIFDIYQIAEARLYGADCVLLIVAMLSNAELKKLMAYARQFRMEPLVEVNCVTELDRALHLGAKFIGINNRNLHTFQVDLQVAVNVAEKCPPGVTLAALSGITGPKDVQVYKSMGIHAVLVGEALMKAADKTGFIQGLKA
ncbi:anthranilate synthase / indole-3-glycerol phosphate synthase [Dispira simplex]|nr:anthranilate synthase / indole-3-glycerol phosphate synthase [Dispira simplex]